MVGVEMVGSELTCGHQCQGVHHCDAVCIALRITHLLPVDDVPEGGDVLGAAVLVLEVVGMLLPGLKREER